MSNSTGPVSREGGGTSPAWLPVVQAARCIKKREQAVVARKCESQISCQRLGNAQLNPGLSHLPCVYLGTARSTKSRLAGGHLCGWKGLSHPLNHARSPQDPAGHTCPAGNLTPALCFTAGKRKKKEEQGKQDNTNGNRNRKDTKDAKSGTKKRKSKQRGAVVPATSASPTQ